MILIDMVDVNNLAQEKLITIKATPREAALIKLLRRYEYGTILVTKQKGFLLFAEPQEKILLREEDGFELTKDVRQQP